MKTGSQRAETAWPLSVLAGSSPLCMSVPLPPPQGEANLDADKIITATPARVGAPAGLEKSTQVSELPPSAQRVNPFPLLYLSPVPPVARRATKGGSPKQDCRQRDRI